MELLDKIYQKVEQAEQNAFSGGLDFPRPTVFVSYANYAQLQNYARSQGESDIIHGPSSDGRVWLGTMFFDIERSVALKDDEVAIAPIVKI